MAASTVTIAISPEYSMVVRRRSTVEATVSGFRNNHSWPSAPKTLTARVGAFGMWAM